MKYNCGNGNTLTLFTNKREGEYREMLSGMQNEGFRTVQSSEIDFFLSTTLEKDGVYEIVTLDKKAGDIRRVTDSFSGKLNTQYKKAGKCPVRMWQFEVDHTLIDCGMCYVFQLTDYSFFVIDSAHAYSLNDDIRLYELLRK